MVHRDIKPENLFLCRDGTVKVLDFGIARLRELSARIGATQNGSTTMGTPAFMPPEQARGAWDTVDGRTDLWGLGATMFTMLANAIVHEANNLGDLLVAAMTKPSRSLTELMPGANKLLVEVVDKALAFDQNERWPDARAMQAAVREAYRVCVGKPAGDMPPLALSLVDQPRPAFPGFSGGPIAEGVEHITEPRAPTGRPPAAPLAPPRPVPRPDRSPPPQTPMPRAIPPPPGAAMALQAAAVHDVAQTSQPFTHAPTTPKMQPAAGAPYAASSRLEPVAAPMPMPLPMPVSFGPPPQQPPPQQAPPQQPQPQPQAFAPMPPALPFAPSPSASRPAVQFWLLLATGALLSGVVGILLISYLARHRDFPLPGPSASASVNVSPSASAKSPPRR
jgi:serine/threonine-protein kinase